MKYRLAFTTFITCFALNSFGQKLEDYFFDEFTFSMNRTTLKNQNTEDRLGFGLGAYHSFLKEKKINIVFGLEYNQTNQLKKIMPQGMNSIGKNLNYKQNTISVPLNARFLIGNKVKLFLDAGMFTDFLVASSKEGTLELYQSGPNQTTREMQLKEAGGLSIVNYGLNGGIGIIIPLVKNYGLIFKSDYKWGLRKLYSYHDDIYNSYLRFSAGFRF